MDQYLFCMQSCLILYLIVVAECKPFLHILLRVFRFRNQVVFSRRQTIRDLSKELQLLATFIHSSPFFLL